MNSVRKFPRVRISTSPMPLSGVSPKPSKLVILQTLQTRQAGGLVVSVLTNATTERRKEGRAKKRTE